MSTAAASSRLSERVRLLKPSSTLAVSARVKALKAEGVDVIGFGVGEPDFDTPTIIRQAAMDALRSGMTHYAPVPGEPEAREAIADKLRRENGIDCRASDIVITVGGKHALYEVLQVLIDPGQRVALPTPAWVSYKPMAELAGAIVDEIPGAVDNDFKITPDQLEAALTPDTAAFIINSPSNPCGTMYTPDELNALGDVLAKHPHVTIITDEIYEKLIYGGVEHFSLGSRDDLAARTVTVNGLSKAFAMTGWRIGYLCAPGNDGEIAKAVTRLQGQMTSNITSFVYPAIVTALNDAGAAVELMRETFAARAKIIRDAVGQWPNVRCPQPTGAFYVFPDISAYLNRTSPGGREMKTAVDFAAALLDEAHVAVVPGDDFGDCGCGHVRLSFAASDQLIRTGCERIRTWLEKMA